MHIERNVFDNILKHLFGERDTIEVHKVMEEVGVKPHQWLQQHVEGEHYVKLHAPYVFTPHERQQFLDFISKMLVPTGYVVAFKKHVGPNRLFNLKNHDHHVVIQHVLLNGIRSSLQLGPRTTIIRLGRMFQQICTKVVVPNEIGPLSTYVAETLCMLEIWFPPGFFNLMTHLFVHIVDELKTCELVASRWCYPMECYLTILKNYV
jgi:hypothetical protein